MAINHLLFDLDGTLVDTAPDLVAALNFVLTTHGKPKVSLKDARCWAGAGSARLIEQGFFCLTCRKRISDSQRSTA
ncbi:MAG TPA: hypothetical protein EYO66_06080 [Gammaproteobacteria bacterium]|nr:hypothetical protein [Gammaproteobacteria bacterium]